MATWESLCSCCPTGKHQAPVAQPAVQGPQPFDNRPTTYHYLPRGNGYGVGASPSASPASASDNYMFPGQPYAYCVPQYPHQHYYVPAPAAQPMAPPQPGYYFQPAPPAHHYFVAPAHDPVARPYVGRSTYEVHADDLQAAQKAGSFEPREIQPKDAKPESQFWVKEVDGSWNLRNYYTIENALRPGRWQVEPSAGYLVFVRENKN